MNIKKSSNLYRYLSWLDKVYESKLVESKSLCPLFWKTILMTLFLPICFTAIIVFAVIGKTIENLVMYFKVRLSDFQKLWIKRVCLGIAGVVVVTFIVIIVYLFLTDFGMRMLILFYSIVVILGLALGKFLDYLKSNRKQTPVNSTKDTSIKDFIAEGFSSIKNRVCPLINFVEEKDLLKL